MRLFRRKPSRKRLENIIIDLHREVSALRRSQRHTENLKKHRASQEDINEAKAIAWMNEVVLDDELERVNRFILSEIVDRKGRARTYGMITR